MSACLEEFYRIITMTQTHHIVIVGGGAGGLELATKLGNKLGKKHKARITLVDTVLTHVWKPLLHEVAAGSMNSDSSQVNFRAHAQQHHFEFQLGLFASLDRENRTISLAAIKDQTGTQVVAERQVAYDTLVIAVGSSANDFGTPGAKEHCLFLDSLKQARHFHKLLLSAFLRAEFEQDQSSQELSIAIVGAGATGVELAAELRHASRQLEHYGMHNIQSDKVKLTLIEAADRILPALPERLSKSATIELERLNVRVITGDAVTKINDDELTLKSGEAVCANMKVWAAGIKAPNFLATLDGLETNRINQLKVYDTLQVTKDAHIFSFGDCAECPQQGKEQSVPPRAQSAHQQASTLVKTLTDRLYGRPATPFVYHDHGSLISFSQYTTVGNLMGNLTGKSMMVEGKVARLFYLSLYRMHQVALHGILKTGLIWLNDRLTRVLHPRLKLH